MLWQREGIDPPQRVAEATKEYKAEMDLLAAFMDACITIEYGQTGIPANQLYSVYVSWAEANKEYVMTSRKFFSEIAKKLPDKKRVSSGMIYQNIRLTEFARSNFAPSLRTYSAAQFH